MSRAAWLLTVLAILGMTACATTQSVPKKEPPLPKEIKIIPPSPQLPKEIAIFSGKWTGTWPNKMESILIVEEIHETWAQVIWSWTNDPQIPDHYFRNRCKIIYDPDPKIVLEVPRRPSISFVVKDSDTIEGIYQTSMAPFALLVDTRTLMKRVN
jgi:hypothetical protein